MWFTILMIDTFLRPHLLQLLTKNTFQTFWFSYIVNMCQDFTEDRTLLVL